MKLPRPRLKALSPRKVSTPASPLAGKAEQVLQRYGDLLFDLCESVLWDREQARLAVRSILKTIRAEASQNSFTSFERAWTLRIAFTKLLELAPHRTRRITAEEQIRLDATAKVSARLKNFDHYFHRLRTEDQILLLLRDKYGLPLAEIATAMGTPEGSLRIRRKQALRALEEWLWDKS